MRKISAAVCLAIAASLGASATRAEVVELTASKDNTLYESGSGTLSNGAGDYLFAGTTLFEEIRRGLIAFDVAGAVPAGATIDSVSLTLTMSKTIVGAEPVSLHRVLADWGEGASDAPGEEGAGGASMDGDATWIHTFKPAEFWAAPGGDHAAAASATEPVDAEGPYTWSSPEMAADVQAWLDDPSSNFGWMLIGNEEVVPSAKRFDSRENGDRAGVPMLVVEFSPSGGVPATSDAVAAWLAAAIFVLGTAAVLRYRL